MTISSPTITSTGGPFDSQSIRCNSPISSTVLGYTPTTYTPFGYSSIYSAPVNSYYPSVGYYNNYNSYNTVNNGGFILSNNTPTMITLTGEGGALLSIDGFGNVTWSGSITKCSEAFVKNLCSTIDIQTAGANALSRTYLKAVKKCLRLANNMTKEELIAALELEVETRTSKQVLSILTETDEEEEV